MTATALALVPTARFGGPQVLHGRELRPGTDLADTSEFDDACWNLTPAILQRHAPSLVLDFDRLPTAHRDSGKQLFYALLSGPLPPGVARRSIPTVRSTFASIVRFLHWTADRPSGAGGRALPLRDLSPSDLEDYGRHLLAVIRGRGQRAHYRATVRLLWHYRDQLDDALCFDPGHLEHWGEPHGTSTGENSTDRIPEPVAGGLLAWALRYLDAFADDIVNAADEALALKQANPFTDTAGPLRLDALAELLYRHERESRPLPGFGGEPNTTILARRLGCYRSTLRDSRQAAALLAATAARVGVDDDSYLETPVRGQLDGAPWLGRIAYSSKGAESLGTLARMLQTACYIVIAYLSGMRDGEIKHLERGCVTRLRDSTGTAYRFTVTSLAFKGEADPAGTPASWVVGRPVERAVQVLEQLQPADTTLLFARLPFREGRRPGSTNPVMTSAATTNTLAEFISWVNAYCDRRQRTDAIPDHDGHPWRLTTRQFRRTLAWFIARRPGGTIAGAVAYRHLSVQLFEGYAGTSDSGFRAEVESEQAIARGEHLLAMIDQHEHFTGPAAHTAERRLDGFAEHRGAFPGQVVTDPRRLLRIMTRNDPAIYPGAFVTCVYNPDKALCGSGHADLPNCQPLTCRNAALTADNREALRAQITDLDRQLTRQPAPAPYLAHVVTQRRDAIAAFLATHQPEPA
jgi:hypothetical protein